TVIWTVTDMSGNTATCSFTVTVNDTQLPTITCPMNQTRNTDLDQCNYTAQGTEFDPTFSDNCPGETIAYVLTGATMGSGTTRLAVPTRRSADLTVIWTVTDVSGNTAACCLTVTVNDTQLPTITCPMNQTRNTDLDQCNYTAQGAEFDATFT